MARPPSFPMSGVCSTATTARLTMRGMTTRLSIRTQIWPTGASARARETTQEASDRCNSKPSPSPSARAPRDHADIDKPFPECRIAEPLDADEGCSCQDIPTRSPRSRASFRCPPPDNPELSMRIAPRAAAACIVLALAVLPAVAQQAPPSRLAASLFDSLRWRHIGPEGNRFSAAAGIPGNTRIYYVGAASGGVYKTTDGGVHWAAIFDDQPVQSIGSLAVVESDPNIVWAGTGEGKIRSHISVGQGV